MGSTAGNALTLGACKHEHLCVVRAELALPPHVVPRIATLRNLAVTVLVLALLGGTTAAFAVTEALKLEQSPVTAPKFDRLFAPTCECETSTASLSLRFRKRETVDAFIVDSDGALVRTLLTDEPVPKGRFTFHWDGLSDSGDVVPEGRYRLRIHLQREDRTILLPNKVEVDTTPPQLDVLAVPYRTFSPDGDGHKDRFKVVYRVGERASMRVLANGSTVVRSKRRPPRRARISWGGRIGGVTLPAGAYEVVLQAVDRAGNVSESELEAVRIRYIELTKNAYRARPGGVLRFRAATDSLPFRWELFGPEDGPTQTAVLSGESIEGNVVQVRFPKDLERGLYELRVDARGHSDQAVVLVGKVTG